MIQVRPATLADIPFIRELTLQTVTMGIPENRDILNETVLQRAAAALDDLELRLLRKREVAILIAVDTQADKEEPAGFLILELNHVEDSTGDPQTFINNVAVLPQYWGRYVAHQLVSQAARLSHQRGFKYMTCMVTASNRRSLLTCLHFGFEVERLQLVVHCGPEGRLPMPGRSPAERAHHLSRLLRQIGRAGPGGAPPGA